MNITPSKSLKMITAGMAIAVLSASVYARGGEGCDYGYGPGYGYGMHGGRAQPERLQKLHEQHLAALHDKLKLSAQQEAAWTKYASQQPVMGQVSPLNPEELQKLNAPQRAEKMLEHLRAVEAKLAEHLAAMKEFYAVLTPEQQKIFDEFSGPRRWSSRRAPR